MNHDLMKLCRIDWIFMTDCTIPREGWKKRSYKTLHHAKFSKAHFHLIIANDQKKRSSISLAE